MSAGNQDLEYRIARLEALVDLYSRQRVTPGLDGLMSLTDKAKLDAATSANTPGALVQRDSGGAATFGAVITPALTLGGVAIDGPNLMAPPRVAVRHSVGQSIASGVATNLAFDTEDVDNANMHDPVTNNGRLTCRVAGVYDIVIQVQFAANATGGRLVGIKDGAGNVLAATWVAATPGGAGNNTIVSAIRHAHPMAAGDYVVAYVYQTSGGALNVDAAAPFTPRFTALWRGAN